MDGAEPVFTWERSDERWEWSVKIGKGSLYPQDFVLKESYHWAATSRVMSNSMTDLITTSSCQQHKKRKPSYPSDPPTGRQKHERDHSDWVTFKCDKAPGVWGFRHTQTRTHTCTSSSVNILSLPSIHPFEGTTILGSVKQAKAYFTSLLVSVGCFQRMKWLPRLEKFSFL